MDPSILSLSPITLSSTTHIVRVLSVSPRLTLSLAMPNTSIFAITLYMTMLLKGYFRCTGFLLRI